MTIIDSIPWLVAGAIHGMVLCGVAAWCWRKAHRPPAPPAHDDPTGPLRRQLRVAIKNHREFMGSCLQMLDDTDVYPPELYHCLVGPCNVEALLDEIDALRAATGRT